MRTVLVVPAVAFAGAVAVIAFRAERFMNVPGDPNHSGWAFMDFRDTVYFPGRALLDGNNPYDAAAHARRYPVANTLAPYLPGALLIGMPMALLPYVAAEAVWMVLMIVAALATVALARALAGRPRSAAAVLSGTALLLLSRPGQMNALLGQATLVYVLGTYLALGYAERAPYVAIAGLALAALKPTYGLPVATLLAARGDGRVAASGVALAGVVSLAVIVLLVPALLSPDVGRLLATSYAHHAANAPNATSTSLYRVDAPSFLARIVGRQFGLGADVAIGCVVLAVAAAAMRLSRARGRDARVLQTIIVCVTTLLCTYHQSYDIVLLAWPIAELAPRGLSMSRAQVALLALLVLPFVNFAASESGVDALGLSGIGWTAAASLNAAALTAALLVAVVLAWRGSAHPTPAAASQSAVPLPSLSGRYTGFADSAQLESAGAERRPDHGNARAK